MTAARSERIRSLKAGERLGGKLELRRVLGHGGMGEVWIARNILTDADVALKVLWPGRDDEGLGAARFRHEARLGAMLGHRSICKVYDLLEEDDGTLVLVMEVLRGETLLAYAKSKGKLPTREAVAIIVAVLSGLQHAHDHDVVHRDIKPGNIFLHVDPDGHVAPKLFDFGIAKVQDTTIQTRDGEALGTPSYMSPEQVRTTKLDGRSDLFGIGVVLYEMITGDNPFRGDSPSAALARVLELEVDPHPDIDPKVWIEIQRALSKQAYSRHASAAELADALATAVGETSFALGESLRREKPSPSSPDLEPPPSAIVRTPSRSADRMRVPAPSGRRRVIVALLVALAMGCAVVIAIVIAMRSTRPPVVVTPPAPSDSAASAPPSTTTSAPASTSASASSDVPPATSSAKRPGHPIGSARPASSKPIARNPGF